MASIFEEIAALDRPFVPVMLQIGSKLYQWKARRPNALEADALDCYYSDEYAKLILKYTEPVEGGKCEIEQMRETLKLQTIENVINQIMSTRSEDVQRATFNKIDFEPGAEARKAAMIEDEAERNEYLDKRKEEFTAAYKAAEAEIRAEYEHLHDDAVREMLAQMNLNMKCLMEASAARKACFVFYALYDEDEQRICPSAEEVREKFQGQTITYMFEQINAAFALAVKQDLPFVSPGEGEPSGQPTSVNTSEPETTPLTLGGRRIRRRRRSSKRSSTPLDGTPSKKD